MASVDFDFDLGQIKANLAKAAKLIQHEVVAEMYASGEEIMAESKDVYCPVDSGTLVNSGHVEAPQLGITQGGSPAWSFSPVQEAPNEAIVRLGYGGAASAYAVYVHEMLDVNVHWNKPGSGPKYLEIPWNAKKGGIAQRIDKALATG